MTYYDVTYKKTVEAEGNGSGQGRGNRKASTTFIKLGRGFVNDKGIITFSLDAKPVKKLWDGKYVLFPHEEK